MYHTCPPHRDKEPEEELEEEEVPCIRRNELTSLGE